MFPVTLYGMMVSGNTARARSYLVKAGIPFCERAPSTPHYLTDVVPLSGGIRTMPTLEFADGRVIRDGAAIIAHFEQETGHTFSPKTPKQRIVSYLFDVIGAEGLLRPGMHYRWNFEDENLAFLDFHTAKVLPPGLDVAEITRRSHDRTRRATKRFGVDPSSSALVEQLYLEQLKAMDRHFSAHPYLLGGRPCIGDFGLMIMMFGHLGRDPKPMRLMHTHGLNVMRWTERMNRRDMDFVEFEGYPESYLADDEIPDTLIDLLRIFAEDFVPETRAAADTINAWIAEQDSLSPGTPCDRWYGFAKFDVRGTTIKALAAPYRFFLLKRAQDAFGALEQSDKLAVRRMLDACNMTPVLDASLSRDIGRDNNAEIWL